MYRLSSYNFYLPFSGRVIYFNGISSKIFSVNENEHEKLKILFNDLISFEINYNSIFEKFKEWGFIIEDNKDEIDILRYRNRKAIFLDRGYRLIINPTLECNFNCWYCYEKHSKGFMNNDIIENCKRHIHYMVRNENIKYLNLDWFGGEPLLYFNEVIYPIGLYAKKLCDQYHIPFYQYATTNAYKIDKEIVNKMKEIGFNGFQITIDGDEKRHDKIRNEEGKPTFEVIMQNINLLCDTLKNINITLRINYDDITLQNSNFDVIFEKILPKNRHLVNVNFQRIWQTINKQLNENELRIQLFKKSIDMGFVTTSMSNVFKIGCTHKCYADRFYHAVINFDGKVFRCTARDYSSKYVVGKLLDNGKIDWDENKMAIRYSKATFENRICLKCKYLPLCMGPCSQKMVETLPEDLEKICYLNSTEIKPETVILNYYTEKIKTLVTKDKKNES